MKIRLKKSSVHSQVEEDATAKLPGFVIDRKLSWEAHISEVCKRLSRVTLLIRKLKACMGEDYILTFSMPFTTVTLAYELMLWGHASGCSPVLRLLKKVGSLIRITSSSDIREHWKPIFVTLT